MYPTVDSKKTGQKIKQLMLENNLTPKDIQEYLSLACIQTIYRWLNGITIPSVDNLYALSALFNVSMDEIIQGNRYPIYTLKENICYYTCH